MTCRRQVAEHPGLRDRNLHVHCLQERLEPESRICHFSSDSDHTSHAMHHDVVDHDRKLERWV
eukprot:4800155-Pyramimonas_sp.AAC.1